MVVPLLLPNNSVIWEPISIVGMGQKGKRREV